MFKNSWKLIPYLRPFKWDIIFLFVSGFVLGIISSVPSGLIGLIVNAIGQKPLFENSPEWVMSVLFTVFGAEMINSFSVNYSLQLKVAAFGFPLTYLVFGFIRYLNYYRARYFSEAVGNELRYSLLHKLVSLNQSFFARVEAGAGGLLSRTLNDTLIVQQGLNQYIDLLREPFIAIISLVLMFVVNYKLALVCLIFAPIVGLVIQKVSKTLRALSHSSQESLDRITKSLKEAIDGIRIIHSYNLEDYVRQQFRNKIDEYNRIRKKVAKRHESTSPINEFLASIVIAGMCYFVGILALKGEADLTTFTIFIALAANLEKPIKKIQQAIIGVQQTEVSITRVFQIIDNTETVSEFPVEQQKVFPENWKEIHFKNIDFSYNEQKVLREVDLKIKRGESIAIVGESGAGKSTLVNLIERFIDPSSGGIYIDGININEMSLKDLRAHIAYVSQDTFLFDETVEQNIRLGDESKSHEKLIEAAQKANALKFIEKLPLGFKSLTGERGSNFSGGEKQRLSIARAIFKDADILILDEATSALDSSSEAEVQKGIATLLQDRTSLIIAHRLSTIQSADRIVVMDKGQIVEVGTHEELLGLGKMYAKYYKLQEMISK